MADDDLIRRGDAAQIMAKVAVGLMRVRDAQLAIAALPAQGVTWQPIETVPMDGTRVDLWSKEDCRMVGCNPQVYDLSQFTHWMPITEPSAALAPAEAGGVEATNVQKTHIAPVRVCPICDIADCATHRDAPAPVDARQDSDKRRKFMAYMDDKRAAEDAPVDALVKAAEEAAEVVHKAYVSATMEAVNAGPSHPLRDNFDKWRVRCLRAEEALHTALAALRGDAK